MLRTMSAQSGTTRQSEETKGVYDGGDVGVSSGISAGIQVATDMGWRPVDVIAEGEMVLTFDAGMQPVTKITRRPIWIDEALPPRRFWPLFVPAGALGNRHALELLPHQFVMVESNAGEELFGDPFSLIRSEALDGVKGIDAVIPRNELDAITLHFETDQVIFERSGVLFHCPSSVALTGMMSPSYRALSADEAMVLVACIENDAAQSSVWVADPDLADCAMA